MVDGVLRPLAGPKNDDANQLESTWSMPRIVESGLRQRTAGLGGPTFNALAIETSSIASGVPGGMTGITRLSLSVSIGNVPIRSSSIRLK